MRGRMRPVKFRLIPKEEKFYDDFATMARNQVINLRDRRIRTVSYVCEA